MTAATSLPLDGRVPPEIVSSVFHSATVSDNLAILVAETSGGAARVSWGNQGAVTLLGYAIEDLRKVSVQQLFPTLRGGELGLLLRSERSTQMTVPVRTASGEARAAPVKLDYVSIAGARIDSVDALVVRDGLETSLLGMSYLGRLSRFEATPEGLILRP